MLRLRPLVLALSVLTLFVQPSVPQTTTQESQNSQDTASSTAKHQQKQVNCTSAGTYVNSKGQTVPRPETCSGPPRGATAQCRDGTYSFSQSRRGTCSHHGGVAKWL